MTAAGISPAAIPTREAAAAYIGCGIDTMRFYEESGLIVPKAHGRSKSGRTVYLVRDLDALLDSLPEYERRRR